MVLGDLVSEQQITLVVALRFLPRPIGVPAGVSLRLSDWDSVLFPGALAVDFEVTDAARDRAQPINLAVLLAAATQIAAIVRAAATDANRRGAYRAARDVLADGARDIRALAPSSPELDRIARALEVDAEEFAVAMSAVELKRAHFISYSERMSRDARGRTRKERRQ